MAALPLSVSMAPHTAGARPVLITLETRYEMQCGWPGPGSLVVRLPVGMAVPTRLAARSAIVNGMPATPTFVDRARRVIAVPLPRRPQVMCDSIGPGSLSVTFTRGAKLGAPTRAGSYVVRASHGADTFAGGLSITR